VREKKLTKLQEWTQRFKAEIWCYVALAF